MNRAWIAALAVCAATSVAAAERPQAECVAATRDTPTLSRKVLPSARFRIVEAPIGWERRDGKVVDVYLRTGEETAQLTPRVKLQVNLGGCETYSNVYRFTIPREPKAGQAFWLRKSAELIALVEPANLDTGVDLDQLRQALLKAAKHKPAALEGPIRGEDRTFDVKIEDKADATVVTVGYYIAL